MFVCDFLVVIYVNIIILYLNKLFSVQIESTCRLLYTKYKIIHKFEMFDRMGEGSIVISLKNKFNACFLNSCRKQS